MSDNDSEVITLSSDSDDEQPQQRSNKRPSYQSNNQSYDQDDEEEEEYDEDEDDEEGDQEEDFDEDDQSVDQPDERPINNLTNGAFNTQTQQSNIRSYNQPSHQSAPRSNKRAISESEPEDEDDQSIDQSVDQSNGQSGDENENEDENEDDQSVDQTNSQSNTQSNNRASPTLSTGSFDSISPFTFTQPSTQPFKQTNSQSNNFTSSQSNNQSSGSSSPFSFGTSSLAHVSQSANQSTAQPAAPFAFGASATPFSFQSNNQAVNQTSSPPAFSFGQSSAPSFASFDRSVNQASNQTKDQSNTQSNKNDQATDQTSIPPAFSFGQSSTPSFASFDRSVNQATKQTKDQSNTQPNNTQSISQTTNKPFSQSSSQPATQSDAFSFGSQSSVMSDDQPTSLSTNQPSQSTNHSNAPTTTQATKKLTTQPSIQYVDGRLTVPMDGGVGGSWARGNEFLFYPLGHSNNQANKQSTNRSNLQSKNDLAFVDSQFSYGVTGSLIHAWHKVFDQSAAHLSVHQAKKGSINRSIIRSINHLFEASKQYRAELDACLIDAAQSISQANNQSNSQSSDQATNPSTYQQYLLMLEQMGSVFHLFEIVFIDQSINQTNQLIDWYHRKTPIDESEDQTDAETIDSEDWWIRLLKLVARGRINQSIQMIDQYFQSNDQSDQLVNESIRTIFLHMLSTIPSLTSINQSINQFIDRFNQYQSLIESYQSIDSNDQSVSQEIKQTINQHPYLSCLLRLLAGDQSITQQLSDDWIDCLITTLMFRSPLVNKYGSVNQSDEQSSSQSNGLAELIEECKQIMSQSTTDQSMDQTNESDDQSINQLYEYILSGAVHRAIGCAAEFFNQSNNQSNGQSNNQTINQSSTVSTLFLAHLTDLLDRAGYLTITQPINQTIKQTSNPNHSGNQPVVKSVRDFYITEYTVSLLYHPRYWMLTPAYIQSINQSNNQSINPMELLCEVFLNQPMNRSLKESIKLVEWARKHSLPQSVIAQSINQLVNQSIIQQEYGTAVRLMKQSNNQQMIDCLLDQLIEQSIKTVGHYSGVFKMKQAGKSSIKNKQQSSNQSLQNAFLDDQQMLMESSSKDPSLDPCTSLTHVIQGVLDNFDCSMDHPSVNSQSINQLIDEQPKVWLLNEWMQYLLNCQSIKQSIKQSNKQPMNDDDKQLLRDMVGDLCFLLIDQSINQSVVPLRLRFAILTHIAALITINQPNSQSNDQSMNDSNEQPTNVVLTVSACDRLLLVLADNDQSINQSTNQSISKHVRTVLMIERACAAEIEQ